MIAELGHFALILALCIGFTQSLLPLLGAQRGVIRWMSLARSAAYGQFLFIAIAFATLVWSFIVNDFSVVYVAQNSNTALPFAYRIAAVWGAHEGSLLLWSLILTLWMIAVARLSGNMPPVFVARVLAVMAAINVSFILFMLLTSNPFLRHFPAPGEGRDLNPLLQDPGLVMHPPMLYMGYVGFSVAFSFAIAALIGGRLDAPWARWSRPWTVMAWTFLTIGITLGSWWAYYELGWGGWWFWDPVENASFMPWLVGTALIHTLAVTDTRSAFKRWTCLLAICAFSLSLLGTFLVRSGVLTSVHAFATDPERGVFILAILGITVGGSLLLYALRAPAINDMGRFALLSREGFLLCNNIALMVAAASVLLGTLYPLLLDAFGLGKISVGHPYFDTVFIPLMLMLGILLGVGPLLRWKSHAWQEIIARLWPFFFCALILALSVTAFFEYRGTWYTVLGLWVVLWILFSTVLAIRDRLAHQRRLGEVLHALSPSFCGMVLAHIGLALTMSGVTITSLQGVEKDVKLSPGKSIEVAGYQFRFTDLRQVKGPNYRATEAVILVLRNGTEITTLYPQKRIYAVQANPMTEAAIDAGLSRDLYVAMGEPIGQEVWSMRIQIKPWVRFIWLGGVVMALGGILAVSDRRYRPPVKALALKPIPVVAASSTA